MNFSFMPTFNILYSNATINILSLLQGKLYLIWFGFFLQFCSWFWRIRECLITGPYCHLSNLTCLIFYHQNLNDLGLKPVLQFLGNVFDFVSNHHTSVDHYRCVCVIFKSLPHAYEKDSCIFDIWYPWSSMVLNSKGSAVETLPSRVTVTGVIYCPHLTICSLEAAPPMR